MDRLMAVACAAVLVALAVPASASAGSRFGPNVLENRNRIATAMLGALRDGADRSSRTGARFADINLDGYWEIVADGGDCADCAPAVFMLLDGRYADLLAGVVSGGAGPMQVLDETTKGYRDLRLGTRLLAWDGGSYVDVSGRAAALEVDGFVSACSRAGEYGYYAHGDDAAAVSEAMCACVGARIAAMGFVQADLDGYRRLLEARKADEGIDTASLGALGQELSMMAAGCAVRNDHNGMLPVAPQMYATWTENYGELVGNPYYSGDPLGPENPLDYDRLVRACAASEDVRGSQRIATPDRALGVCGCLAERLSMAGAQQKHLDAVAGLYDYSVSEEAANQVEEGLVEFNDREANWCTDRLAALVDHRWPENPE